MFCRKSLFGGVDFENHLERDSELNFEVPWRTGSESAPPNQAVGNSTTEEEEEPFLNRFSMGTSFWLFRENFSHCKKTCISTPA
jgi:hypothetical protein